jgi:hypothetical protein
MDHVTLKRINYGPLFAGNNFNATNMVDQTQITQLYTTSSNHFAVMPPSTAGNVGVGITNPAAKLNVFLDTNNVDIIRASTAAHSVGLGVDSSSTYWGASIFQDGTKRFTVESNYGILVGSTYQGSAAPANGAIIEGSVGIGVASPTAALHLKAGTATASTAPLKLTSGIALTTPEDGAIEYHSSHLYFTIGTTRYQLDQQASGLTVGTTAITGGVSGRVLYNNGGVLGEMTTSGTGTELALTNSPSFTTPSLGVASATTINKVTITTPATGSTLTIADGKTLSTNTDIAFSSTAIQFAGGTITATFPTGTSTLYGTGTSTITSAQLATSLSDETGTAGSVVFSAAPALTGAVTASGTLRVGSTAMVSNALIGAVVGGNGLEFGHTNSAGYRGTIGAESSSGRNFLAFHAEAGTNANTYRTRGVVGSILTSDAGGGFIFGKATTATADNQALTNLLTISNAGAVAAGTYNSQTISATADFTGTLNVATGFKVAGAATTGNVLRGNGTNFISATLGGSDITGAALTKTDDTNVTLTLGGTPATSLLRAASITVGWSGTLSPARGGTGVANNAASTLTISGAYATTFTVSGVTSVTLPTSGTLYGSANDPLDTIAEWQSLCTNCADIVNDTTGTLTVARGGTGGTSASITLFNNITGYTASGATGTTSTNLVFSTSPTIATPTVTTSAVIPLIIGGTSTTSTLTLRSTSGSGTTGADIIFQAGNNGALETMRILNSGYVGIGMSAPLRKFDVAGSGRFTGTSSSTLTGTADPAASTTLSGTSTLFTTELVVGDRITVNGETRTVTAIASDTSLTVDVAFTNTASASVTKLPAIFLARTSGNAVNLTLNDQGNLGIGTAAASPSLKMEVAGSMRLTGPATSVLTGTIDPIASTTVTGVGTKFLNELVVGDRITVTGETRTVTAIASDLSLTVDSAFSDNANDTSPDKLAVIFVARDSSGTVQTRINDIGTLILGPTGSGKITYLTADPVYTIGGVAYATYAPAMIGIKEETTGLVDLTEKVDKVGYRYVIDFKNLATASDLWLFANVTNVKKHITKMSVLLSPEGNTRAWYQIDPDNYTLTLFSSKPTKVSYRLSAPRIDADEWTNFNHDGVTGMLIPNPVTFPRINDPYRPWDSAHTGRFFRL